MRWLDYTDPATEPWWVDVLLVVLVIGIFIAWTAVPTP